VTSLQLRVLRLELALSVVLKYHSWNVICCDNDVHAHFPHDQAGWFTLKMQLVYTVLIVVSSSNVLSNI